MELNAAVRDEFWGEDVLIVFAEVASGVFVHLKD